VDKWLVTIQMTKDGAKKRVPALADVVDMFSDDELVGILPAMQVVTAFPTAEEAIAFARAGYTGDGAANAGISDANVDDYLITATPFGALEAVVAITEAYENRDLPVLCGWGEDGKSINCGTIGDVAEGLL
jgi:hypothetical protein